MTFVTAAILGFYSAPLAFGGLPELTAVELLVSGGLVLMSARELWTRPVRLWWRSLGGGVIIATTLAFAGGLGIEYLGVSGLIRTLLVVVVIAPSVVTPRLLARSSLTPGGGREVAG